MKADLYFSHVFRKDLNVSLSAAKSILPIQKQWIHRFRQMFAFSVEIN